MSDDALDRVPAVLEVRELCVRYGEVTAVDDVSLQVRRGEMLALLGPSGSGKSTLLHSVAGFQPPSSGEVWLKGRRVATHEQAEPPEHRDVAVVFQSYALWPHLSALDNVAYPIRRRGVGRRLARDEALHILSRLRVSHLARRRPAELSGGEQQRVAIARALIRNPDIVLADEPTGNLDSKTGSGVLDLLKESAARYGQTIIMVTHDPRAAATADRVVFLADGRVVDETRSPKHDEILERIKTLESAG